MRWASVMACVETVVLYRKCIGVCGITIDNTTYCVIICPRFDGLSSTLIAGRIVEHKPKLLEQARRTARLRDLSRNTETSYMLHTSGDTYCFTTNVIRRT